MAITNSTALYNKYRPQRFDDVVGQTVPMMTLRNAIETQKISNAYLLSGLHGTGKTSLARIFAKALLCTDVDRSGEDACGKCPACRAFDIGSLPDYIEEDAASNRGIDNIRALIGQLSLSPQVSHRKVVIIDEVHHLTNDASTSLLKKLEEPPAGVVFLLVTTDPMKIPSTIRSRCQWLRFKPIDTPAISHRLARIVRSEGAVAEPGVCDLIAESGAGSMRDAVSNLSQVMAFAGNRPITCEDVSQCLGVTSMAKVRSLANALANGDLATAMNMEFPEDEGGAKGALRGVLNLLHKAMLPVDPEEKKDMTVETLRMREMSWVIHASDVIERNFWKLDNASFPDTHVVGEMCVMIIDPATDPHCSNALAGIPQPPAAVSASAPVSEKGETVDRILRGVMTVYRELHGMTEQMSGMAEQIHLMEETVDKSRSEAAAPDAHVITSDDIKKISTGVDKLEERSEVQGKALKTIIELLRSVVSEVKKPVRRRRKAVTKPKDGDDGENGDGGDGGSSGGSDNAGYRQPAF